MASSGTALYTISRNDLVTTALRMLGVLREGDVANATQMANAMPTLQMMVKNMQSNGLALWTYQQIQIPMVGSQTTFTIGPSGTDVVVNRPLRLMDGSFIRLPTNPSFPQDTPLRLLSRIEYLQFSGKLSLGVPNSIYYDCQITAPGGLSSPSFGYGTLYVYVTPQDATRTIFCNFQRPLFDMDSDAVEFDFPQEWFLALKFMLAGHIAYDYPQVDVNKAREIRKQAKELQDNLQDWSVENSPIYFQPDLQMTWNARR